MSNNKLPTVSGYKLQEMLGQGAFGKVYLAVDCNSQEKVALKYFETTSLQNRDLAAINKEISLHRELKHPQIVKFHDSIENTASIMIALEYVEGGTLQTILDSVKKLDENHAGHFLRQILCGVQYLHENSVVHLDLKPANILVDLDLNVRIADFGSSEQIYWGEPLFAARFTRAYAAPEVHAGNGYDGELADIWSLGVMIYHLVTGDLPFKNAQELESMTYVMPNHVSSKCSALISGILREQTTRYTLYTIRSDAWIANSRIH